MRRPSDDHAEPDGLDPDPSTRRAPSGSPASNPPRPAGEPDFSETSDAVFAVIKARISRLWEAPDDLEAQRALLTGAGED